ncbi:MAG: HAMP domain-containing protein [Nitrospirae bacterium]|nr:HAMP domain-containing protein [Nitrospirota bacterium]
MKSLSLRYKLFIALSAMILFYTAGSVLFVNLYLKDVLKKHFIDMGQSLANAVSSHIVDDMLIENFVGVDAFFEDTMRNNPGVSYLFVEKDGHVLLHTFKDGFPKKLLNIGHKKSEIDYMLVEAGTDTYYDFSYPIFGGRAGILRVGMSGKIIYEMIGMTVKNLLYVALAAVVVALAFSIMISRRLINPLSMLTASAMKIAGGDYSKTAQIYGSDEVGKLSIAFNKMTDAVKIREKELREINEELETVNIKLHEYIEELNRTKDELVKSKQDAAVIETSRAMIHHMRQPLTYLIMAIELFTDEIQEGSFNADAIQKRLHVIEEAGRTVAEILKKFENLKEYRSAEYSDKTKIIDIGE